MLATEFAPLAGLIGGILIGLSAAVLMAFNGRVAGASGIFGGLFTLNWGYEFRWRLVFVIGMLAGAAWSGLLFFDSSAMAFSGNLPTIAAAGLLVGAGTCLGSGCTSGHGICGLARLSKRSLAATCTFMAVAIVTVFVTRHMSGV
ncbi:MAG: YeeE/YedE family protein [Rhizobiales bacterium]|nr:YeeE/YedE family protein [Hyphomicrobiales bacterium]